MGYLLRFFDDYGSGWLWAGNDAAFAAFDVGPLDELLQSRFGCFPPEVLAEAAALSALHAGTLNLDDPLSPLPLPPAFCADFNRRAKALHQAMAAALGPGFTLRDEHRPLPLSPSPR